METFDAKHLVAVLEKQGQLLERIAKAAERSNEILYALLSPQQLQSLSKAGVDRLAASIKKPAQQGTI